MLRPLTLLVLHASDVLWLSSKVLSSHPHSHLTLPQALHINTYYNFTPFTYTLQVGAQPAFSQEGILNNGINPLVSCSNERLYSESSHKAPDDVSIGLGHTLFTRASAPHPAILPVTAPATHGITLAPELSPRLRLNSCEVVVGRRKTSVIKQQGARASLGKKLVGLDIAYVRSTQRFLPSRDLHVKGGAYIEKRKRNVSNSRICWSGQCDCGQSQRN